MVDDDTVHIASHPLTVPLGPSSWPAPASRLVASSEQIFCEHDGEAVILHITDGIYYGLNKTATRVWRLLQEPIDFETLSIRIQCEIDVDPLQCKADLAELMRRLRTARLVHDVP